MNHTYAEMSAVLAEEIAAATPEMVDVRREQNIEMLKTLRESVMELAVMAERSGIEHLAGEFAPIRWKVDDALKALLLERELRGERG